MMYHGSNKKNIHHLLIHISTTAVMTIWSKQCTVVSIEY